MTVPRALRRWFGAELPTWYHPAYRLPVASSVPMDPRRADDALTWAMYANLVRPADVREPAELSWEDAALVHTDAWLAELDRPEIVGRIIGSEPARVSVRELLDTWRHASQGTVEAVRHVLAHHGRAINLLGGFHHAERGKGGGFCALDDVAIAIACARRDGFAGRVVIVDLDAHPPDGLVDCLGADPRITILSISTASGWTVPVAEAAAVVDRRVPPKTTDEAYLGALDDLLKELPSADLAIYLAGSDPLADDLLGGLALSEDGLRTRDRRVLAALGRTPTAVLPAGGYHPRSWRVLAGTICELQGDHGPIPPGFDPQERRTREVMRMLDPKDLGGVGDVLVTEEELFGSLGVAPRSEPRFLGYYTRHGLEHALTAYGYLHTLRRLGFQDLKIELESGAGPDRMRITAKHGDDRATLVDLAASIQLVEGYRVLFVEWLELTDPRGPFPPDRPQLPGQRRPGLGMADETMQLLVRAAERLDLAGIAFVPAHYHVAWMARDRFVVVDPEERGRFLALTDVLRGVPLIEASIALGGPGLPTEDGDPARWKPVEMVASLDQGLTEALARGDERAAAAREVWSERLLPWTGR